MTAIGSDLADGASGEGLANAEQVAAYTRNNDAPEACRRITEAIVAATSR